MRYFGVPATSVPPQIDAEGVSMTVEFDQPYPWISHVEPPLPTIKPPADPGVDGWTWEAWDREQRAMTQGIDGWSPCRFAHRSQGKAKFVFGLVRGPFGMWKKPLVVHRRLPDGSVVVLNEVLTCATHLRSGMGMGVFEKIETAALACNIASKAFTRWGEIADQGTPLWREAEQRVLRAWWELGIVMCNNSNCQDGGITYAIYGLTLETVMDGKPEKFS